MFEANYDTYEASQVCCWRAFELPEIWICSTAKACHSHVACYMLAALAILKITSFLHIRWSFWHFFCKKAVLSHSLRCFIGHVFRNFRSTGRSYASQRGREHPTSPHTGDVPTSGWMREVMVPNQLLYCWWDGRNPARKPVDKVGSEFIPWFTTGFKSHHPKRWWLGNGISEASTVVPEFEAIPKIRFDDAFRRATCWERCSYPLHGSEANSQCLQNAGRWSGEVELLNQGNDAEYYIYILYIKRVILYNIWV